MKHIYYTDVKSFGEQASCLFWTDSDPYVCRIQVEGGPHAKDKLKFILSREGTVKIVEV